MSSVARGSKISKKKTEKRAKNLQNSRKRCHKYKKILALSITAALLCSDRQKVLNLNSEKTACCRKNSKNPLCIRAIQGVRNQIKKNEKLLILKISQSNGVY